MQTQPEPRFKRRLPCRLKLAGSSHTAMVLNLSRSGLFVQTSAAPPPGAAVVIDLDVASGERPVPIEGRVVWRRAVASHLRSITRGGVGIRIVSAPDAYYSFLSEVAGGAPLPPSAADAAGATADGTGAERECDEESPGVEFRVRVKQEGGSRTRMLTIQSVSEEEARNGALEIVGSGWAILDLKPVSD